MNLRYTIPAGYNYAPYLLDLIEGNHTLIAGTTGAGKSVLENSIINAIMCEKFPGQTDSGNGCKLILIDPKRCELALYKDLPHTLYYADTMPEIESTFERIRAIIENRLETMQKRGQRKTSEPSIYVFIDELVDIVTSARSKQIMRIFADCISISRATGVFFVICTQSPARGVIPAVIKLNCSCRVALKCNDAIESRQIIDSPEAVNLPRHGLAIVKQNLDEYMIKVPLTPDSQLESLAANWSKQHRMTRKLFHL